MEPRPPAAGVWRRRSDRANSRSLNEERLGDQLKRICRIKGGTVTVTPARQQGPCLPVLTLGDRVW
jgi:hypothetical protein